MRLTLDAAKFDETLRYTGPGAAANNYLAQSLLRFNRNRPDNPLHKISGATPIQLVAAADAYRQERQESFKAYAATRPVPAIFRAYVRQSADFERGSYLLYFGMDYKRRPQSTTEALPADF